MASSTRIVSTERTLRVWIGFDPVRETRAAASPRAACTARTRMMLVAATSPATRKNFPRPGER